MVDYVSLRHEKHDYRSLCKVINKLQRVPFTINSDVLQFLLTHEDVFVSFGLLMSKFLENVSITTISEFLRSCLIENELKEFQYGELVECVKKTVQRCRYERLILGLAEAYNGYKFYLPAFLDFRGRIYRCGILHFHESDLARSLIVFADTDKPDSKHKIVSNNPIIKIVNQKFRDINLELGDLIVLSHYDNKLIYGQDTDKHLAVLKKDEAMGLMEAKHPFQYLASCVNKKKKVHYNISEFVLVTKDASSSAYQIVSFLNLDKILAIKTNRITPPDGKPEDLYSWIQDELKSFMDSDPELDKNLSRVVSMHMDRKIVKSFFMPMIYGKTLMSAVNDLRDVFSQYITRSECYKVGRSFYRFFKSKFSATNSLIRLIRLIGWFTSSRERPNTYGVGYVTTVQNYLKKVPCHIWVYDPVKKKRKRVTLRVESNKPDTRKTETATFVNFIHQIDAYLAMRVVHRMQRSFAYSAPIYTVHDNFIL